jgi:Kef-type K+ transport system membrane component KefB
MAMLRITGFLACVWTATKVSKNLKISSIVLEISTGVLLGPDIGKMLSPEYSVCEQDKYVECGDPKDPLYIESLVGHDDEYLSLHYPSIMAPHVLELCHRGDYHHDSHGGGHGGGHGGDHGPVLGHGDDHGDGHDAHEDDHGGSGMPHDDAHDDGHAVVEDHGDDHGDSHDDHGDSHDDHGSGQHRRLSGGGNYHSFEECIVSTCAQELSGQCQRTPDVFTLIGHTGVALMIFESGMHFDFGMAKIVGPWACVVATLGTILPLICGSALAMAYGNKFMPDAITAGTALAPTSVGMSLKLLTEAKMLDKNFGQSIMTAAFVDDILSLILFNIIFSMGGGSMDFMHTFFPAIMGIIFMVVAVGLAVVLWPKLLKDFMAPAVKKFARKANPKTPIENEAILFVMLVVLTVYAFITYLCGTHLWGCFIAGMSFACLGHEPWDVHEIWEGQTKRITKWMLRIFFACTVAFSIPVFELVSFDAFWKGSIMGIGPCIATKVFCAFFMGQDRWVIGWAMVGRAEFAYLIAQMGMAGGMMDKKLFSICIWALLWATVFAPLVFTAVLKRYVKKYFSEEKLPEVEEAQEAHGGGHGHGAAVKPEQVHIDFGSDARGLIGHEATPATGKAYAAASPDNEPLPLASYSKGADVEDASPALADFTKTGPNLRQRAGMEPAGNGTGFLCCLFFRKIAVQ